MPGLSVDEELCDSKSRKAESLKPTTVSVPSGDDLDFIEIGTSNFETLIQEAPTGAKGRNHLQLAQCNNISNHVGLSVEALKMYQDQLPDKAGVKKITAAISGTYICNIAATT